MAAKKKSESPAGDETKDQQPAAEVEGDVKRRFQRCGHLDTTHRCVGAGVVGLDHRRVEEERQEGSGEEHDHEAPQRNLTQHERPVVGEDLASERLDEAGEARALIEVVGYAADELSAERSLLLALVVLRAACGTQ